MGTRDHEEPDVADYVTRHAPELDINEVMAFMNQHDKPADEKGLRVEWAVRALRQRRQAERRGRPSIDQVVNEMRRHDA